MHVQRFFLTNLCLQDGDEIIMINGNSFTDINHCKQLVLEASATFTLTLRRVVDQVPSTSRFPGETTFEV